MIVIVSFEKKKLMRQVFCAFFVGLIAIGCDDASGPNNAQSQSVEQEVPQASEEDLVREAIELVLVQQLNDPDSYEFVAMSKGRITTLGDNIDFRRKQFARDADGNADFLAALDSLELLYADDLSSIRATDWSFRFRGSNALGAKVLNEFIIQVGPEPDFQILKIADNPSARSLNPNDIPGWKELASEIISKR